MFVVLVPSCANADQAPTMWTRSWRLSPPESATPLWHPNAGGERAEEAYTGGCGFRVDGMQCCMCITSSLISHG